MKEPNPRRFALWALGLVIPLVLGAVLLPHLRRKGSPVAAEAPAAAEVPTVAEVPPAEQLEEARAAGVALGRVEQRNLEKAEVIAPRGEVEGAGGEVTRPFEGFGLSVDSIPPGARVLVNGRDAGETPLLASVACRPGDPVEVHLELPGHRTHRRTVTCIENTLIAFGATLRR